MIKQVQPASTAISGTQAAQAAQAADGASVCTTAGGNVIQVGLFKNVLLKLGVINLSVVMVLYDYSVCSCNIHQARLKSMGKLN